MWRRRHGTDRPEDVVVDHGSKVLERRQERRAWPNGVPILMTRGDRIALNGRPDA